MNDQVFVNEYIRILNETLNDAFSKNLVMQAQLASAKQHSDRVVELEAQIRDLNQIALDNNELHAQINNLKNQIEQNSSQLNNKNSHVETFKKELIEARNTIKELQSEHVLEKSALEAEITLLNRKIEELTSKKKKKDKALNNGVVEDNNLISISDTF